MGSKERYLWHFLATEIQQEVDEIGVGRPSLSRPLKGDTLDSTVSKFNELVTNGLLQLTCRSLFVDGHYARAVEEAFKCLNNEVKAKAGLNLNSLDGAKLMRDVFSKNNPKLKLNSFVTQSEMDEQQGYMDLFVGSMIGIRNPRAHDHQLEDDEDVALELLILANHLMRKLDGSMK